MTSVKNLKKNIRPVGEIYHGKNDLPDDEGTYAFWWLGTKEELLAGVTEIILKGPNGKPQVIVYKDWWPEDLVYPCLYVGKSTKIKTRFGQHIKNGTPYLLHTAIGDNTKVKPKTTSCQLRHGIEHVFPNLKNPLALIHKNVGFSYETISGENAVVERFFQEDLCIGLWRPWFNIDSER